jgi:hypothetical protein
MLSSGGSVQQCIWAPCSPTSRASQVFTGNGPRSDADHGTPSMSCLQTSTMSTLLPNGEVPMPKWGVCRPMDVPARGHDGRTQGLPATRVMVPISLCFRDVPRLLGIIMASLTNIAPCAEQGMCSGHCCTLAHKLYFALKAEGVSNKCPEAAHSSDM